MDTFTPRCSTCWLPACNRGCDNEAKDPGACEVTSMAVQPQPVERPWVRFYDDGVPAHLTYPDILLHHILEQSARKYPRLTALLFFGRQITYADLDVLASRFAAGRHHLLRDSEGRRHRRAAQPALHGAGDRAPTQRRGRGSGGHTEPVFPARGCGGGADRGAPRRLHGDQRIHDH